MNRLVENWRIKKFRITISFLKEYVINPSKFLVFIEKKNLTVELVS